MLWKGSPEVPGRQRTTSVEKPARASPGRASHDISLQPASQQGAGGRPAKPPKFPCPEPMGLVPKPVTMSNGIEFTRLRAPVCKRDRSDPALAPFPKCTRVTPGWEDSVSCTEIPILLPPMTPPRTGLQDQAQMPAREVLSPARAGTCKPTGAQDRCFAALACGGIAQCGRVQETL